MVVNRQPIFHTFVLRYIMGLPNFADEFLTYSYVKHPHFPDF